MNLKRLLTWGCLVLASTLCGSFVQAQEVTISPIPQSIQWSGAPAFTAGSTCQVSGLEVCDSDAASLLKSNLVIGAGSVQFVIGEREDSTVAAYAALIPQKEEGYYLKVTADSVIIAGYDNAGTYYGVQSYLQIASQPTVMQVVISDYPDVKERGLVEGYYGNPYSETDRLRMFDFFGKQKMNTYIYGPKDDPYHKSQWRTNYPAAQGKKITEYVETARKNKVTFVWAIHPGGDIKWNLTDSLNIVKKLKAMYNLGVRAFAVFFDDIGGDGTDPARQAGLLNYITQEIVNKLDGVAPLIMCPTQYNKSWSSGSYLSILGTKSDASVRIMWTGNSVVDMIDAADMTWINQQISRKAYIWLNYPVNDYCVDHMLMGPTYGNDRTIFPKLAGFTSNPMEYAEASKVSLYSLGDYLWNMGDYNYTDSWERAIKFLMPRHSEAFHLFCENNIDLGVTGHGLRRAGESPLFTAALDTFNRYIAAGDTVAATTLMGRQFRLMIDAVDTLTTAGESPELMAEITPWCQVMRYVALKGEAIMDMYRAITIAKPDSFINSYLRYKALDEAQLAVRSRNYSGSIKAPNPVVATTFVVPFLKSSLATLINYYKGHYTYRKDVLPTQQIENGNYFIKVNGKYLTNETENVVGSVPHFVAARDQIKPQRQEWNISLDPTTGRYKIVNVQDGRYLNENGKFSANNTSNPYEAVWHTYNILRLASGKYAIQNAGSAGSNWWTTSSDGSRVQQGTTSTLSPALFIFEIVPTSGIDNEPVIETSEIYYIKNGDLYLTNTNVRGSGGTPTFKTVSTPATAQEWKFTLDGSYYKLTSNADSRYVNELGVFGTNSYYTTWNTYLILEQGGLFSIQTTQDAGTHFWNISGTRIAQDGSLERATSYLMNIVSKSFEEGITGVTNDKALIQLTGHTLTVKGEGEVDSITLYGVNGIKQRECRRMNVLNVEGISRGLYIAVARTTHGNVRSTINIGQ